MTLVVSLARLPEVEVAEVGLSSVPRLCAYPRDTLGML